MRVKHLWDVVPLPSKLKLAYSRVTLNLPTTVFFILALVQCLFQISLHIWSYTHHLSVSEDLGAVALNSTIIILPLAVRAGDDLLLCKDIPKLVGGPDECTKVALKAQNSASTSKRSFSATPNFDEGGNLINLNLLDSKTQAQVVVTAQCVSVWPWAFQSLRETNREDLTFIAYQVWLFGVSLTAILNESIPHLIAALASEALATIGSAVRIVETSHFQADFKRIVVDGSCDGADLLGAPYFQPRRTVEIVICALNAIAFLAFIGLSWRLIQTYGQRSFERVHKRPEMSRLYIVILTLCSCVQLATFFMVVTIGLFIDQLALGPLRSLSQHKEVYLAVDIILLVLVVPWMILGWTSGRVESEPRTIMFLALTIIFMAAWATTFASQVYHLLFMTWNFFAMTSVAPMVLMFAALLLAIYSWFHLNLGLAEYLKAEEPSHPADKVRWSLAITPDPEKGGFPLSRDGSTKPQVIWVHPQSPTTIKFPKATQGRARSHSTSSVSTKGSMDKASSKGSHRTTGSIGSRRLTKSRSISFAPDPYAPPPPGLMPPPVGLPVISIPRAPIETPAAAPSSQMINDSAQIRPPTRAVTHNPLTAVDAAASEWERHSRADTIVSMRPSLDVPPPRRVTKRPPPLNGLPSSIRPSQGNRF